MKTKAKLWLAGLGGVLLLTAILILLIHSGFARRYVAVQLADYLRREMGIDLQAESFRYNLFTLSGTARNVSLRSAANPVLPPFLTIESFSAQLRWEPLLKGMLSAEYLNLDGVTVQILADASGQDNLPVSAPKGEMDVLPKFLVSSLDISRGSLIFNDQQDQFRLTLPRWEGRGRGNGSDFTHEISLTATPPGETSLQGRVLRLGEVAFTGILRRNGLDVRQLVVKTADSDAILSGRIDGFSHASLDMNLRTTLALAPMSRFAGAEEISGNLEAQSRITGSLESLTIKSHAQGRDVSFREYRRISFNTDAEWRRGVERLMLSRFLVTTPFGTAQGSGNVAFSKAAGSSDLRVRLEGVDLLAVSRLQSLPILIASTGSGTIAAQWPALDFSNFEASGNIRLVPARGVPSTNVLPVSAAASFGGNSRRILAQFEYFSALGSRWEGRLALESLERLEGTLQGTIQDLGAFQSDVRAFSGEKIEQPSSQVGGSLNISADLSGSLSNPVLGVTLNSSDIRLATMVGASLTAEASISREQIWLRGANLGWRGETASAQGTVGLAGRSPSLDLTANAEQLPFSVVAAALGTETPVKGRLNLSAKIGGTIANVDAGLSLSASDLEFSGEPMGSAHADARILGHRIDVIAFEVNKPIPTGGSGSLRATGWYDLGTEDYALQATGNDLQFSQLMLPGNTPARGAVDLTANGSGNLKNGVLEFQADFRDLAVKERTLGSAVLNASLKGNQANAVLEIPQLKLQSRASLGIESPYPLQFDTKATGTNLADFGIRASDGRPVEGAITFSLTGSGNLDAWKDGEATLAISDLSIGRDAAHNEGPITAEYKNRVLTIPSAIVVSNKSRLALRGFLPVEGGDGELAANATLDMSELSAAGKSLGVSGTGVVELTATARGNLQHVDPIFHLTLKDGQVSYAKFNRPIEALSLDVSGQNGYLTLNALSARIGTAILHANGEAPLAALPVSLPPVIERGRGSARFTMGLESLRLEDVAQTENLTGIVSLKAEGEMPNVADLNSLRAQITTPEFHFRIGKYELHQAEPISLLIQGGIARISHFTLLGPVSGMEASGQMELTGNHSIRASITGNSDLAILSTFISGLQAQGESQFQMSLGGTWDAVQFSGFFSGQQGQLAFRSPQIHLQDTDFHFDFEPGRIQIAELTGVLNGGDMTGTGWIGYRGLDFTDLHVDGTIKGLFLDSPADLRTESNADLTLRSQGELIVIGGQTTILEGSYRKPLDVQSQLLEVLRTGDTTLLVEERSPFLSRIRFNMALVTQDPVLINNNLAKLGLDANLRIVGTYYEPSLIGRVVLEENGEIYLSERTYYVEHGTIFFNNERRIEPELDIQAKTTITEGGSRYGIDLRLTGDPAHLNASLSNDSGLTESEMWSLLLTGRRESSGAAGFQSTLSAQMNVARTQALSLLAGGLGGQVSYGLQQRLGISQIRIDPTLISPEANPGARLTIGQAIARYLQLIYSMNLVNSKDQIYIVQYQPTRRLLGSATRQSDNTYRFDFQHNLQFGGQATEPSRRNANRAKVGTVQFHGYSVFDRDTLLKKFKVHPGDSYDFFKVQSGLDRLKEFYDDRDRLESKIRITRAERPGQVDLHVIINAGLEVSFAFEGDSVSGSVKDNIRKIWSEGLFDAQRIDESREAIRSDFVERGNLQAEVGEQTQLASDGKKKVLFVIVPGPRFHNVDLEFQGASGIDAEELKKVLKAQKITTQIHTEPDTVADVLTRYYKQEGYLQGKVDVPRYDLDATKGTGRVIIPVKEGPRFVVGTAEFRGNTALSNEELSRAAGVSPGTPIGPSVLESAYRNVENAYWENGYSEVVISESERLDLKAGRVDLVFDITENKRSVVEKVSIEGNRETSDRLIQSQIKMAPGDVLSYEKTGKARKNLYDTGAFSSVDIQTRPLTGAPPPTPSSDVQPVELEVKVREVRPFDFNYGGFYDTDRGPGFILDVVNHNSLGEARTLGVRGRYDSDLHEIRAYFGQPLLQRFPVRTDVTVFAQQEFVSDFTTRRTGFSIQEEVRSGTHFLFSAGYRFEHTNTLDTSIGAPFQLPAVNIAPLTASVSWDTRNDFLAATTGTFTSHALEYAPSLLGSDLRFVSYFGQLFRYFPLRQPSEVPFSREKRARLVFASAVRLGLGKGLGGQDLLPGQRFFAGGGTTIRGFPQNEVGPKNFFGEPTGGNALFILNNEIRFPLYGMFDGVAFVDVGNVYPTVSDFDPFRVRKSAGLGLRVYTPYLMLRLDYGLKIRREPGESPGQLFFSIGQAF